MAASLATMQSILAAGPLKGAAAVDNRISPHCYTAAPFMRRSTARNVRCSAEGSPNEPNKESWALNPPAASRSSPPPPPPEPKASTKFYDLLAFGGPAPEVINGRLAMVGFVAAIAVEAASGEGLLAQVSDGGAVWFVGTSVVLSLASLVPLLKGVSVQSKSEGLMSSDAEMWNGRFAMLGLVALALTEFLKGGALV